jgi:sugar/nucleoside kinase (ribokinase family)
MVFYSPSIYCFMALPLVSLGTVALDSVKTPFGRVDSALGGSGTYFSLAASFFTDPGVVSVIGDDFPGEHLDFLRGRGIDLGGVEACHGGTFRWEGAYEFDMNEAKTLRTDLNVLAAFNPKIPDDYRGCDYLFLANIDPEIQLRVLDYVKPGVCLCDTMNFWIDSKRDWLTRVFEGVDGIIINDAEARQYCGTANLIKAGGMLSGLCDGRVIIKKGEHGALFFSGSDFFAVPSYPCPNVVDPTGAGDSFAGGIMGYLAASRSFDESSIKKAMVYGAVIASFVVEGFSVEGLRNRTMEDVRGRYEFFKRAVAFDHEIL